MKNLKKNDIVKCRVRVYTIGYNITNNKEDNKKIQLCEVEYLGVALDNRRIRLQEGTTLVAYKNSGFGKTHTQHQWNREADKQWAMVDNFEVVERA